MGDDAQHALHGVRVDEHSGLVRVCDAVKSRCAGLIEIHIEVLAAQIERGIVGEKGVKRRLLGLRDKRGDTRRERRRGIGGGDAVVGLTGEGGCWIGADDVCRHRVRPGGLNEFEPVLLRKLGEAGKSLVCAPGEALLQDGDNRQGVLYECADGEGLAHGGDLRRGEAVLAVGERGPEFFQRLRVLHERLGEGGLFVRRKPGAVQQLAEGGLASLIGVAEKIGLTLGLELRHDLRDLRGNRLWNDGFRDGALQGAGLLCSINAGDQCGNMLDEHVNQSEVLRRIEKRGRQRRRHAEHEEAIPGRGGDSEALLQMGGDDEPHDLLLAVAGLCKKGDVLMRVVFDHIQQGDALQQRSDGAPQGSVLGGIRRRGGEVDTKIGRSYGLGRLEWRGEAAALRFDDQQHFSGSVVGKPVAEGVASLFGGAVVREPDALADTLPPNGDGRTGDFPAVCIRDHAVDMVLIFG